MNSPFLDPPTQGGTSTLHSTSPHSPAATRLLSQGQRLRWVEVHPDLCPTGTVQYSTVQSSTVQYSTVQYSKVVIVTRKSIFSFVNGPAYITDLVVVQDPPCPPLGGLPQLATPPFSYCSFNFFCILKPKLK